MKHHWCYPLIACLLFLSSFNTIAQDTMQFKRDSLSAAKDTTRPGRDSIRTRRGGMMASLFADSSKLTSSDYQIQIERTYLVLNNLENKSELGWPINNIKEK